MAKTRPPTPVQLQQTLIRALRIETASLRQQARARRMSGPQLAGQRVAMREEASRCQQIAAMLLKCDPVKLSEVLGQ